MNLLFLTPYVPTPIRTRPYNLLKALARRGHRITLLCIAEGEGWIARRPSSSESRALEELRALGISTHAVLRPRLLSLVQCICALPTSIPLQAVYCDSRTLTTRAHEIVRSCAHGARLDVVHIEHLRAARYGLRLRQTVPPGTPIVWDSVDCITHLFQQSTSRSRNWFGRVVTAFDLERTRRYETLLLSRFERVLVTSSVDAHAFARLAGGSAPAVTVLPNGVDLERFSPGELPRRSGEVVFSGKMSYHANISAALYLAKDIMPRVWEQLPEAHLTIAGSWPPPAIRALAGPRVEVTGEVQDLAFYLRRATVAVAPMPYGAGIQNKVLEAMACATPVVATPQAVSALRARPGEEVLVGDSAPELADLLVRILTDPHLAARIGRAGRAYVERNHNWAAIAAALESVYADAIQCALQTAGRPATVGSKKGFREKEGMHHEYDLA